MTKHLIIVPDDHYHKKTNFTFIVYDVNTGELVHEEPSNPELSCNELEGQGRPTFRPFGIASDDEHLYIASHTKLGKYNKKTFEFLGLVDIPMYINTHQMLKSGDDFYVTHTAVNAIGIHGEKDTYFDVSTMQCVDKPIAPAHAENHDTIHVNSLVEHEDKIYFCLHNLGVVPSQFGYFDKNTYESKIVGSSGFCCHDVQILNNRLYALSSGTGEIIEVELVTGQTTTYKVADGTKTFLRGMDVLNGHIVFAGSNRYSDGVIPMNNCYVSTFNVETKQALRLFNIHNADIVTCMKLIDA